MFSSSGNHDITIINFTEKNTKLWNNHEDLHQTNMLSYKVRTRFVAQASPQDYSAFYIILSNILTLSNNCSIL